MIKTANAETIKEAAGILKSGGLVGMPTETVYGLAANALDERAVARIFEAKGRPAFNPLIVHVETLAAAGEIVQLNDLARAAAQALWPGPLTMILPRRVDCGVSDLAGAGLETLAVRVPLHPVAMALLKAVGLPLAAPSANRSGTLSPTSPAHVHDSLGDSVDMILAAGSCTVGLESTVLDLSGAAPVILRPGAVSAQDLEEALGVAVSYYDASESKGERKDESEAKPKSPGLLLKHYAPNLPVRLNAIDLVEGEALLSFGSDKFMGIKDGGFAKDLPEDWRLNLSKEQDLHEAAANLFAMLKELDQSGARAIAVMAVPNTGIGRAINDRLKRAAAAQKG